MNKKIIWGITRGELLMVLLLYILSAFCYHFVVWASIPNKTSEVMTLFGVTAFIDGGGLHYGIFLLFTIPIWWSIFVFLKGTEIWKRLLLHIIFLPIFIFGTRALYYTIAETFGWGHLQGTGQVWDLYIPGLFYLIQFGIFHAYEHYRENQRKLVLEGELRQAALKSELAAIKAQLNPHFLYNVFNTINASVPAENERTRNMIAQLSDLFRYQLQASKSDLVTLREELDFVKKYLELEKERFKDRLDIEIRVSNDLMDEKIPPMLLQPLVENSVKHGLSSLIEGGAISLYIFKEAGKLKFEISDTGVGIKDKLAVFNMGVGLSNTRLRLQKMYQSQIELMDNSPKGLTVKFSI
ncbi:Histidine kinase [Flagellimonas maritima]|uniref:Histidine kinase n=1 Tax=Flagellimonas maritima TaxID=1383885 RepID=A0A2Z4LPB3_9FLAO|nr:histidine kinase [Allomuricauda aurantiaca]AWX43589.1 Histidine kinase [Allomuricauda aurantiaca]